MQGRDQEPSILYDFSIAYLERELEDAQENAEDIAGFSSEKAEEFRQRAEIIRPVLEKLKLGEVVGAKRFLMTEVSNILAWSKEEKKHRVIPETADSIALDKIVKILESLENLDRL